LVGVFGVPPEGSTVQSIVEERLRQALKENGEKLTVEWRGQPSHLSVISVPTELLYYNPDTHRIRAQRTLDPARDALLGSDPWGSVGQDYLEKLLRSQPSDPDKVDPEFEALRDSIDDFGQQHPGLITRSGILVNGNTRCAALRELGVRHIRVAVLPPDTTRQDISTVELSLQLRRENKRDYSYINQLIAIEEQLAEGRRPEDIAREFHTRTSTLEKDRWVYSVIQEAIDRSRVDTGEQLRLVDFEDHQEKLRELHRAYVQEATTNRDSAEALKEARLAMIVLGFSKTDVRIAKPDFHAKYLSPKLPSALRPPTPELAAAISIPGLSIVVADDSRDVREIRTLTDSILKAKVHARVGNLESETRVAVDLIEGVKSSVESALKLAGKDERLRQRKVAAAERISDATESIDLAVADIAQALATKTIDEESIDESLRALRSSLAKLARQCDRAVGAKGDGLAWLIAAVQQAS
jgi:hypothetical protein